MKNSHLVHTMEFNDGYFWDRLGLTAFFGIAIAGALTLFMHVLIEASQQELAQSTRASILDFVRVKRDESSQRKKPKPQRPKTQEAPPAPPAPQNDSNMNDASLAISLPSVNSNVSVDLGTMIGTGDGEYLPIVKVAPAYPIKASIDGTEGTCMVEFTVTTTGATKDVTVVSDFCPGVFARASIQAARKFKYKPRIVDGAAIEVPNVRNIFDYTLRDRDAKE
jgi:protein TonB